MSRAAETPWGLKVVRTWGGGSNPWAIVTPEGVPVEVPRTIGQLHFMAAFFPRKRDAVEALAQLVDGPISVDPDAE
jgi:hypothetical protein